MCIRSSQTDHHECCKWGSTYCHQLRWLWRENRREIDSARHSTYTTYQTRQLPTKPYQTGHCTPPTKPDYYLHTKPYQIGQCAADTYVHTKMKLALGIECLACPFVAIVVSVVAGGAVSTIQVLRAVLDVPCTVFGDVT